MGARTADRGITTGSIGAETVDRGINTLGPRPHVFVWECARVCVL